MRRKTKNKYKNKRKKVDLTPGIIRLDFSEPPKKTILITDIYKPLRNPPQEKFFISNKVKNILERLKENIRYLTFTSKSQLRVLRKFTWVRLLHLELLKKQIKRIKNQAIKLINRQTKKVKTIALKLFKKHQKVLLLKLNSLRGRVYAGLNFIFLVKINKLLKKLKKSLAPSGLLRENPKFKILNQQNSKSRIKNNREKRIEFPIFFSLFGWQPRFALVKIRKKILWPFKHYWQEIVALILLIVMISSSLSLYSPKIALAATYFWTQTNWAGGESESNAVHPTNQTDWTYYSAKDANLALVNAGADLQLSTISSSTTQTNEGTTTTGFNLAGRTFDQTEIIGTGSGASVRLFGDVTAVNNWDTVLKQVPGAVGSGGFMLRNGSDNDIYVLQGNGTTGFYKYSISGNSWTTLTVVPGAVGAGGFMLRNGSDDDIYVLQGNSTGFYKYSISGNSWTTLTVVPGKVSGGGFMLRNGADDEIYVLRGGLQTSFYKYSILDNSWTTLTAVPGAVSYGGFMLRNGADNDIYVLQGNSATGFYKYSISGNSWETLTVVPGAVGSGGFMVRNGADNDIYVLPGGGTGFYKYSISGNSWETLTVVPGTVSSGGFMLRNGADDEIYVLQGNSATGFYKYSILGNSWTTLTVVPGAVSGGGFMLRNGADNDIYVLPGNVTTGFYKYSISGNSWQGSHQSNLTAVPGAVAGGGFMLRNGADNDIYVLQGNSATGFYKYSISGNSWETLTVVPGAVSTGGFMLRNGSDNDIYVLQGYGSTGFYKYSISGNSWETLTVVPGAVGAGGFMLRNGSDDDIYVLQGNSTGFYKYSILGNSWTTLTVVPGKVAGGGFMLRNGADNDIYVLPGNVTTGFYKYSISGNSWETLTVVPGAVDTGGFMLRNGSDNDIYVLQGNISTGFYKYSISGNSWTTLTVVPGAVGAGGFMLRNGSDNDIYVLRGNNTTGFYKYSISGNSWTTLTVVPGAVRSGGFMLRNGSDDDIYVLQGNSTGFYKFIINSVVYSSSGTFTSGIINIGFNVPSWTNLSWTHTGGQTITLKARSCSVSDCSGAPNWASCSNITSGSALSTGGCATNGHQYIQYQASLSTADTGVTPSLDDVTIGYNYCQPASQTLTSSGYDSSAEANLIGGIAWDEDVSLPSGTTVTVSLRTASSSAGLSGAGWTDFANATANCSKSGTRVTCSIDAIPAGMKDGVDDQWFQYRILLESDDVNTPTLSEVEVTYVVNAPPEFNPDYPSAGAGGVSASQNPDGTVTINYSIRDEDTDKGSITPGYITPSFEYWNGSSWTAYATMASGDTDNKAVATSTYNTYAATWYAKTDFNGHYITDASIRVTINDNEAANNTAQQVSADFILDTKDPALGSIPVLVDASQGPALVTLSATDDSSLFMKAGLNSDLSDVADWSSYSGTTTISLATDPDTVYVQFKDAYNNTSTIQSVTTPTTPSNMFFQDISNPETSEWREFIAWGVVPNQGPGFKRYNIYRSTDGQNYPLLTTITNRLANYIIDTGLSSTTMYYYKITTEDNDGNISYFSSVISDIPEGTGGSDLAAPAISNVATSSLTTNSVTITWNTDELSNSYVGYSITSGNFDTEIGVPSMVTSHSVTLTGLTPNTQYYFQVKSYDPSGNLATDNNGGPGYSFETNPGPVISNVTVQEVSNTSAKIVWTTNINSSSYVAFATSISVLESSPTVPGIDDSTTNHAVTITNLTQGQKYYFYVKSIAEGNTAYDKNVIDGVIEYYTFTTTQDTTGPTISDVNAVTTAVTATITWLTDEPATSQVDWGTTDAYGFQTDLDTTLTRQHVVRITGLTPNTTYHFRVRSIDANNNESIGTDNIFTPEYISEEAEACPPPVCPPCGGGGGGVAVDTTPPIITNVEVKEHTHTSVTIIWTTNKTADSFVKYGETIAYGNFSGNPESSKVSHSIILTSLTPGTTYHFKALGKDRYGNLGSSADKTFTTLGITVEAPEEAVPEEEKGLVERAIDILIKLTNPHSVASVSIALEESAQRVVSPPLIAGEYPIIETGPNWAKITWVTDKKSNSLVAYAREKDYDPTKDEPYTIVIGNFEEQVTTHIVEISNLEPLVVYHYQIRSKPLIGPISKSENKTFKTLALSLGISDVTFEPISENEVSISWKTNIPSATKIEYTNLRTGEKKEIEDLSFLRDHLLKLKNLESNTNYSFEIKAIDEEGNKAGSPTLTFSTGKDVYPPEISRVKTSTAIFPKGDKVQTIITWLTDEFSSSRILYVPGVTWKDELVITSPLDKTLTREHTVVISTLKPGTVYRFRVESGDLSGNIVVSKDFTLLTPQQRKTIIQIVIQNFEQTFSWVKRLGF